MRVTTGTPRHVVTVAVGAAIALSMVLLVVATVGGITPPNDAPDASIPPADTTTQDTGLVNPWVVGDAAALRELAELGRADVNACP